MKARLAVTVLMLTGLLALPALGFAPTSEPVQTPPAVSRTLPPDPGLLETLASCSAFFPQLEYVRFAPDGQTIEYLQGTLSAPSRYSPAGNADYLLAQVKALFHLPSSRHPGGLKLKKLLNSGKARHVVYQLHIDGIPVYGATLKVNSNRQGAITSLGSTLPQIKQASDFHLITEAAAVSTARTALAAPQARLYNTRLVYVMRERVARKAYLVRLGTRTPLGEWEILIDAQTGAELSRRNTVMSARSPATFTGKGNVYRHHPLQGGPTLEPLPWLTRDILHGLYADVQNEDALRSRNAKGEHVYPPENTHFDEAMVYYHMNRMHEYFAAMGFEKMNAPLLAAVHYGDFLDNAYYMSWANCLVFGDGHRYHPLSREEAVIYHEYAHAALAQIIAMHFGEAGAMNEGQADYFAAALSGDPNIGEYVVSKANRPYLRTLLNTAHYPEDIHNQTHTDSLIWSGALWDLRAVIGSDCDLLLHKSFFFLKGDPMFIDGLMALLQADREYFQGKYQARIIAAFAKRGISTASPNALDARQIRSLKQFSNLQHD